MPFAHNHFNQQTLFQNESNFDHPKIEELKCKKSNSIQEKRKNVKQKFCIK